MNHLGTIPSINPPVAAHARRRVALVAVRPEAPFGYIALAFPSAKDPTHAGSGKSTAVAIAGDVPFDWFEQWGPS